MWKYCLLATLACRLTIADTLPTLPALSLSVDLPGSGGGCITNFSASGADFSIGGSAGRVCPPQFADVGFPFFGTVGFPSEGTIMGGGTITLAGINYSVTLSGFVGANENGQSPILPSGDNVTLTIPATATGTLVAGCFLSLPSCGVEFTPLADLTFNLPGVITVQLSAFPYLPNTDKVDDESFVSTPEPSTAVLLLLGAITLAALSRCRRGAPSQLPRPRLIGRHGSDSTESVELRS
jgi:hypothetical protein